MRNLPTADLLSQALDGDEASRDTLLAAYRPRLQAFLTNRLPAASRGMMETGDVVQEILLRAVRTLSRFEDRGHGSFWAHLRTMGHNFIRDEYRRAAKYPGVESVSATGAAEPSSSQTGPVDRALRLEELELFEHGLDVLDERSRRAVVLRVELGLEYDAIALDCDYASLAAARMAIRRGLARVAASIAQKANR